MLLCGISTPRSYDTNRVDNLSITLVSPLFSARYFLRWRKKQILIGYFLAYFMQLVWLNFMSVRLFLFRPGDYKLAKFPGFTHSAIMSTAKTNKISLPPISDILATVNPQAAPVRAPSHPTAPTTLPPLSRPPPHHYKHYDYYYAAPRNHEEPQMPNRSPLSNKALPAYTHEVTPPPPFPYSVPTHVMGHMPGVYGYPAGYQNPPPLYKSHLTPNTHIEQGSDSEEEPSLPHMRGNSKRKTRNNLPKETTFILLKWLHDHLNHPYPNSFEKNQLMMSTGLNQQQLSNWFINARRRKMKGLKEQKRLNLV